MIDLKIEMLWEFKTFFGIYYYENGDCYIGEWKNNNKHGKGIYVYSNGDYYYGDWKEGKMDCEDGKYVFKREDAYYKGRWKEGLFNQGKFYFSNGATFEVQISNNKVVDFYEIQKKYPFYNS